MPFTMGRLAKAARTAAAIAFFGVMVPAAQPAVADGGGGIGALLHCSFTTQAPGPDQTVDRRFQEVVITGRCNRPVDQLPLIFVDDQQLDVQGAGVTNRFRFAGLSSVSGLSVGAHTLQVTVQPRDGRVVPFSSTWTFFAR